jgi:hypothetical protein
MAATGFCGGRARATLLILAPALFVALVLVVAAAAFSCAIRGAHQATVNL